MTLTLYNQHHNSKVANKLVKSSVLFTGDVAPYNGVANTGVTAFVLDKLYNANYASYQFGSLTVYGYVAISSTSNGLYQYTVTCDALATAYYAGAMKSPSQYIARNSIGDDALFDYNQEYTGNKKRFYDRWVDIGAGYRIVLTVFSPYGATNDAIHYSGSNYSSYIMTYQGYKDFYSALVAKPASTVATYSPSIISVYVLPTNIVNTFDSINTNSVTLYYVNSSNTQHTVDTESVTNAGATQWKHIIFSTSDLTYDKPRSTIQQYIRSVPGAGLPILNGFTDQSIAIQNNSRFIIHIGGIGDLTFKPSELGISTQMTKIGYRLGYNIPAGTAVATLMIDDVEYTDVRIDTMIQNTLPFVYDSSVISPGEQLTPLFTITAGAVSTIGGILTGNPLLIGGGIGGIATGAKQAIETEYKSATGAYSTTGKTGQSNDDEFHIGNYIVAYSDVPTDQSRYQTRYGKPYKKFGVLQNQVGFVQTNNCYFTIGIPADILREAESICDGGFYIAE